MKILLLTLALLCGAAEMGSAFRLGPGAQSAAVKTDFLTVYGQPAPAGEIVKILRRGETLAILAEVIMPDGIWCQIKEEDAPEHLGYVLCRTLRVRRGEEPPKPAGPGGKDPDSQTPPASHLPQPLPSSETGQTPPSASPPGAFLQALWEGDAARVEEILRGGLDPNLPTSSGTRPLIIAAKKKNPEILRLLLERGADLETRDPTETSALMAAASMGLKENVEILIAAGTDLNARDTNGLTALSWASIQGFPEIVEILVSCGADPEAKSKDGKTALRLSKMVLANNQRALSAALLDDEETIAKLKAKLARYEKVVAILEKAGGKE